MTLLLKFIFSPLDCNIFHSHFFLLCHKHLIQVQDVVLRFGENLGLLIFCQFHCCRKLWSNIAILDLMLDHGFDIQPQFKIGTLCEREIKQNVIISLSLWHILYLMLYLINFSDFTYFEFDVRNTFKTSWDGQPKTRNVVERSKNTCFEHSLGKHVYW